MKLKGLLVGLLTACVLAGALVAPSVAAPPQHAQWRYLIYMVADNNLDVNVGGVPVVEDDFDELMSVGSTKDVACYVFVDRWYGPANLFKVNQGEMLEMTDFALNGAEANMGDPATLRSFVSFVYKESPADHTVLMFWNHGSPNIIAWDDNGPEEGVPDALTHLEVIQALDGYRVDVMGADECLVGQIEVAYEYALGLDCDYLLASQTYTGWRGYPYDQTLASLVADPAMTPRECAMMFVNAVDDLLSRPPHMGEAINDHAAIDLAMVKELAGSLEILAGLLEDGMDTYWSAVSKARGAAAYSYGANAVDVMDLRDFVVSISKSLSSSKEIKDACAAVLEDFDETVIALQVLRSLEGSVHGLGVRLAVHEADVPAYYYGYAMPMEFWLDFMGAYWAAVGNL